MTEVLRVGTRRSPLALAQTAEVVSSLERLLPGSLFEVVPQLASGDRSLRSSGPLDFTDRLDESLEAGKTDISVHSCKDLPAAPIRAVTVAAYPRRGDARDCAVLRSAPRLAALPAGATLGSSSLRRRREIRAWRPDLIVVPLRGNVGTRLERMESLGLSGVLLAAAGLDRLGWRSRITERIPLRRMLPAPGQGALAVEVRRADRALARRLASLDHPPTRAAVEAERAVVRALGGDCDLPLGAYGRVAGGRLRLRAVIYPEEGAPAIAGDRTGAPDEAMSLGGSLGRDLARRRDGGA